MKDLESLTNQVAEAKNRIEELESSLQQKASSELNISPKETMSICQTLYEAGLITYMRTDSVNLSDDAKSAAQEEIISSYGEAYSTPRNFKNKSTLAVMVKITQHTWLVLYAYHSNEWKKLDK